MLKYLVILTMCIASLLGCAYSTKNISLDDAKSIYVPLFANETYRNGKTDRPFKKNIDNVVSDAVLKAFLRDSSLKLVSKQEADLMLEGAVTSFIREPLRYSDLNSDNVEEYRVSLGVTLKLTDLRDNSVIWEKENITQVEDYYVDGSTMSSEDSALSQAAYDLAKDVVIQVVESW